MKRGFTRPTAARNLAVAVITVLALAATLVSTGGGSALANPNPSAPPHSRLSPYVFTGQDAPVSKSAQQTAQERPATTINVNIVGSCNDSTGIPAYCHIQPAINAAVSGDTISVGAGVYDERLTIIGKSLNIVGQGTQTNPPNPVVIIRPTIAPPSGRYAIVEAGDPASPADKDKTVNLTNLRIDGVNLTSNSDVVGVRYNSAGGTLNFSIIENIVNYSYGIQRGVCVITLGAFSNPSTVNIEDSIMRTFNKQAISSRGTGTVNLRRNRFTGQGAGTGQQAQNFFFFQQEVTGQIANNTFENIGPSGGPSRLIATDNSIGFALGLVSYVAMDWDGHHYDGQYNGNRALISITGNTFQNIQGIWYDEYLYHSPQPSGLIRNAYILANNTVNGGYVMEGTPAVGTYMVGEETVPSGPDPKGMIQYVVNFFDPTYFASPDITVGPGTYAETVSITPQTYNPSGVVHLLGPNASVNPVASPHGPLKIGSPMQRLLDGKKASPLAQRGPEAVVGTSPTGGFSVNADDVVIDGFTVETGTIGVSLAGNHSGYQVKNNIIKIHLTGIYLGSSGAHSTLIQHNVIRDTVTGPGEGGIYGDGGIHNVTVDGNSFVNNAGGSITFAAVPSVTNSDAVISNNQSDSSFYVMKTGNTQFTGNTFNNPVYSGIALGTGNSNITVSQNTAGAGSGGSGVIIADDGEGFGPDSNINVNHNDLFGSGYGVRVLGANIMADTLHVNHNNIAGNGTGLWVDSPNPTVDATNNWWGSPGGPTFALTPGGDTVHGPANTSPYLHTPATGTGAAFAHLVASTGGPNSDPGFLALDGEAYALPGTRFNLDMMVNGGSHNVIGAQNYLGFDANALQVVGTGAADCSTAVSTVTADLTTFDATLQNEVCDGPGTCTFNGNTVPAGSIAYASGALNNPAATGDFRVAQMGLCTQAVLGDTHIQWQNDAPNLRDSYIIDDSANPVSNFSLYSDYVVHVVAPQLVGHVTWQGIPQPSSRSARHIDVFVKSGTNTQTFSTTTDASGFFTVSMGTLPSGTYQWWAKGSNSLASAATFAFNASNVFTSLEMGTLRGGDANNDNRVDLTDFGILRLTFGGNTDLRADFDNSGLVNTTDFTILHSTFGTSGAPHP